MALGVDGQLDVGAVLAVDGELIELIEDKELLEHVPVAPIFLNFW